MDMYFRGQTIWIKLKASFPTTVHIVQSKQDCLSCKTDRLYIYLKEQVTSDKMEHKKILLPAEYNPLGDY